MSYTTEPDHIAGKGGSGRTIGAKATLDLWVRSGGRCARCNTYLMEEPFFEKEINLGERAHIAGRKASGNSPRADSKVPVAKRNEASNLILLCQPCHTTVDNPDTRDDYPEDLLLQMKRDHEERIFHLTGLEQDRQTAVLRVFGLIRGSMPELSRQSALRAVYDGDRRYAKFPLAPDRHTIELNLGVLGNPEELGESYWTVGASQIRKLAERIASHVHDNEVRHLSVFALARIPFMILLGFELDDKVPVELYQKHRGDTEGWLWPEDGQSISFEWKLAREGKRESEAVLLMSLSGSLSVDEVPSDLHDAAVFEIRPVDATPNPNLFRSRATLDAFSRCYQDFLASLESERKQVSTIHLLPAVPITAAIAAGRHLMRHVQPQVAIYDKVGPRFVRAITINQE